MSHRVTIACLAVALVAAACAPGEPSEPSAWADEEREVPALVGIERSVDDSTRRVDTTIDPEELEPPVPPAPTIGDLTIPCGPATEALEPAPAPGVTRDSITIGTGNDRGGLYASGSGRGIPETIRVLADRCNALGGINGRFVEVVEHDAAVIEVVDVVQSACRTDFALVGQGYLLDSTADFGRVECGLPSFPAWTTLRQGFESLSVSAVPSHPVELVLDGYAHAAFFAGASSANTAVLVPDTLGGRSVADRISRALRGGGIATEVVVFDYPLDRQPDWTAIVDEAAATGAGLLWVEGSCESTLVPILDAVASSDWRPGVVGTEALYDPYCASTHSDAVEGTLLTLGIHPAEDRGAVPAVDEHVQLLRAAGVSPTADALRAASAFWLWASATSDCAEPLTRGCALSNAVAVDEWTAGGLHPVTDPGTSTGAGCVVTLMMRGGGFERVTMDPPGQMNCRPGVVVAVG